MTKKWYQQKTTRTALAAIATAAAALLTGQLSGADAFQTLVISLIGIFLRQSTEANQK